MSDVTCKLDMQVKVLSFLNFSIACNAANSFEFDGLARLVSVLMIQNEKKRNSPADEHF